MYIPRKYTPQARERDELRAPSWRRIENHDMVLDKVGCDPLARIEWLEREKESCLSAPLQLETHNTRIQVITFPTVSTFQISSHSDPSPVQPSAGPCIPTNFSNTTHPTLPRSSPISCAAPLRLVNCGRVAASPPGGWKSERLGQEL